MRVLILLLLLGLCLSPARAGDNTVALEDAAGPIGSNHPLPTADTNGGPFTSWPPITPSNGGSGQPPQGTYTVPAGTRQIAVNCTVAGNVLLTDASGNVLIRPLVVGYQELTSVPVTFTTTATATFQGQK